MAMGQEEKDGEGQEVSSASSLPMRSPQVQEDQATILSKATSSPPPPLQHPYFAMAMGQEEKDGEGQEVSPACSLEKAGQEVGEDEETVLQTPQITSRAPVSQTLPVAMGQEDEDYPQTSLPAAHPVPPQQRQVDTYPPSLLAPSPQEQNLQVAMGWKYQEDQRQAGAQASASLLGQG